MQWNIVGCGYTGERLARALLADGHRVRATVRSPERLRELETRLPALELRVADLSEPHAVHAALVPDGFVVWCVPPVPGSPAFESAILGELPPCRRLVYLSSTGVYAPAQGALVDEDFALTPQSEHGVRRLEVETLFRGRAVILRIAAIYGPGRGVHARISQGDYRIVEPGTTYVSRVHVDDLVSAIRCVAQAPDAGARIFNVADLEPASSAEVADGVADLLGVPRPPRVSPQDASPRALAMLGADRRVDSSRLRDLGWVLRYPTWREGTAQAIAEEEAEASARA